jgi:DNA-binding GntR family transcriptional regulator
VITFNDRLESQNGKINMKSLKDQAYDLIRDAILRAEFKPGRIVSNEELSKWLGISRTPIREALLELQKNRMVIIHRGKGTEIAPMTKKDAREIFEMREALEAKSHELAIDRMDDDRIGDFEAIFKTQVRHCEEGRKIEFLQSDRQFHLLFAKAADNERLYSAIEGLRDQFMLLGNYALYDTKRMNEVIEEHIAIMDALKKKDKAAMRSCIIEHLKNTYTEILKLIVYD